MKTKNKEIVLHRLKCGCLVQCNKEGGATWIQSPLCKTEYNDCEIDNYYKEHKPCPICGRCLKCFPHTNHNHIKYLPLKVLLTIYSCIITGVLNIVIFIRKRINK